MGSTAGACQFFKGGLPVLQQYPQAFLRAPWKKRSVRKAAFLRLLRCATVCSVSAVCCTGKPFRWFSQIVLFALPPKDPLLRLVLRLHFCAVVHCCLPKSSLCAMFRAFEPPANRFWILGKYHASGCGFTTAKTNREATCVGLNTH